MGRTLIRFQSIFVGLTVLLASASAQTAQPNRQAFYNWFDTLGFTPKFQNQFVHVTPKSAWDQVGFVERNDQHSIKILTPTLREIEFRKTEVIAVRPGNLKQWLADEKKAKIWDPYGQLQGSGFLAPSRIAASHHWDDLANWLFRAALQRPVRATLGTEKFGAVSADPRVGVSNQLLTDVWAAFNDEHTARTDLRRMFLKVAAHCPPSPCKRAAVQSAAMLEQMIAEDRTHHKLSDRTLAKLGPDARAKELIWELRNCEGYSASMVSVLLVDEMVTINIFGSPPAEKLFEMGPAAFPALVDALKDRRFTRSAPGIEDGHPIGVFRVRDAALTLLGYIGGQWAVPRPNALQDEGWPDAIAFNQKQLAEERCLGEFSWLCKETEQGNINAASTLARRYPRQALEPIKQGFFASKDDLSRQSFFYPAAHVHSSDSADFLRDRMTSEPNLAVEVEAAKGLYATEPKTVSQWATSKWNSLPVTNRSEDLTTLLVSSGDETALSVVTCDFPSLTTECRVAAVQATNEPVNYWSSHQIRPTLSTEKLLARSLTDEQEIYEPGTQHSPGFNETRICDLACEQLSRIWPRKYQFTKAVSTNAKDASCLAALETWRKTQPKP